MDGRTHSALALIRHSNIHSFAGSAFPILAISWPRRAGLVFTYLLFALAVGLGVCPADAAQTNECDLCRRDHSACTKNHSKGACKTELDICLKHCAPKANVPPTKPGRTN